MLLICPLSHLDGSKYSYFVEESIDINWCWVIFWMQYLDAHMAGRLAHFEL